MPLDSMRLAFDRASARFYTEDGHLKVATSHISKANVCGYRGSEIPGSEALGLDPDKIYQLLRDPEELARAAPTFNSLPLLSRHMPVTAAEHRPDLVIGSTGTDAVFRNPYLDNSLVVWDAKAIAGIESGEQRQISCGYRYDAIMKPGVWQGARYSGRMTRIRGNHVALVADGRAGDDVVVMDSNPLNELLRRAKMRTKRYGFDAAAWPARGRDEEGEERDRDLQDGWEREAAELDELLRSLLSDDDFQEVQTRMHRLLLSGPEADAMGSGVSGIGEGRPAGRDAGPPTFAGMPRTGARDATYTPTMTSSPGTDRRRPVMAGDAALRVRRLEAEFAAYYKRFPEARRARVIG